MGKKFWSGLQGWGSYMMKQGVFTRDELGFAWVTDSPQEAADLVLRSLPPASRGATESGQGVRGRIRDRHA